MNPTERVLALNMECLTVAEIEWLHELKNRAAVMTGRLQLKHLQAESDRTDQTQQGA